MSNFQLHPRLQQDTITIGRFKLSQLLMINDSLYPWFVLVPQRDNVTEVYQLDEYDRQQLQQESCLLAEKLNEIYHADKMNIAAIGNIVPQLHIHHIVRFKNDVSWPKPIWGQQALTAYSQEEIENIKQKLSGKF
jgi:diadenosine tetraphosphate (Ap4A) HIT family hydrolase